jgi:UDP-N-acetylglucosamine--N-acetylmuramyl-(pentapeptide) pyrophosphoryl-undecaprenol N-acetylglucosamine transferase
MKCLITGGHITPALSVIDSIQDHYPDWKIVFVGRKVALEGSTSQSEEYRLITERSIPFISITAGRIRRFLSIGTILSILKIPIGFIQAIIIVSREKPDCILSFGGYVGLPLVIAGWMQRIPVVIHEQTAVVGLSNRIASWFATKICVSMAQTKIQFSKQKVVVTGLPIRASIFHPPQTPTVVFPKGKPIIYITGGATGAQSVNELLYPIIGKLVTRFVVVHQVGRSWISKAKKVRLGLRGDKRGRYIVCPYMDENNHAWFLQHAALFVGRSGANTVAEVGVVGIPALFLPLPWSAGNEQYFNAKVLEDAHKAKILDQKLMTPQLLLSEILTCYENRNTYKKEIVSVSSLRDDVAKNVVSVLASLTKKTP